MQSVPLYFEESAYRWNQTTQTWTQLLAWLAHDDWNWTGVESIAPDLYRFPAIDPTALRRAVAAIAQPKH